MVTQPFLHADTRLPSGQYAHTTATAPCPSPLPAPGQTPYNTGLLPASLIQGQAPQSHLAKGATLETLSAVAAAEGRSAKAVGSQTPAYASAQRDLSPVPRSPALPPQLHPAACAAMIPEQRDMVCKTKVPNQQPPASALSPSASYQPLALRMSGSIGPAAVPKGKSSLSAGPSGCPSVAANRNNITMSILSTAPSQLLTQSSSLVPAPPLQDMGDGPAPATATHLSASINMHSSLVTFPNPHMLRRTAGPAASRVFPAAYEGAEPLNEQSVQAAAAGGAAVAAGGVRSLGVLPGLAAKPKQALAQGDAFAAAAAAGGVTGRTKGDPTCVAATAGGKAVAVTAGGGAAAAAAAGTTTMEGRQDTSYNQGLEAAASKSEAVAGASQTVAADTAEPVTITGAAAAEDPDTKGTAGTSGGFAEPRPSPQLPLPAPFAVFREKPVGQGSYGYVCKVWVLGPDGVVTRMAEKTYFPNKGLEGAHKRLAAMSTRIPQDPNVLAPRFMFWDEERDILHVYCDLGDKNLTGWIKSFPSNEKETVGVDKVMGQPAPRWVQAHSPPDFVRKAVCMDTAKAVAAVHQAGYVDRDVKPENMMLMRDGQVSVSPVCGVLLCQYISQWFCKHMAADAPISVLNT